jgi:hypothetical protein
MACTAYVKAISADAAREIAAYALQADEPIISGLRFDDPNLPEVSLSPAMTLQAIESVDVAD